MAGSPAEMRIEYDGPDGQEGDIKTLSVLIAENGKMVGANVSPFSLFFDIFWSLF